MTKTLDQRVDTLWSFVGKRMYDKQFEFLDMLAIISFGLQMECLAQQRAQTSTNELMLKLEQVSEKLDKLLQAIS